MAKDKSDWDLTADEDQDRIGGGPGASDANSGAGNATGTPDAETGMRAEEAIEGGDVDEDRAKLFPEAAEDKRKGRVDDDTAIGPEDQSLEP
jgi:hypothetical protein